MRTVFLLFLMFIFAISAKIVSAQSRDSIKLMLPVSHQYPIDRLTLSPDQHLVATSSSEGYIKVWDVRTQSLLYTLKSQAAANFDGLKSLCFTPDDRYLLAGWLNVEIWDMKTGFSLPTFKSNSMAFINSLDITQNSKLALSALGSTVCIWEIPSGKIIQSVPQHGFISSVKFLPGDTTFLVGCRDSTFRLFKINAAQPLQEFKKNDGEIRAVTINHSGTIIASGTDRSISLWDARTYARIKSLPGYPMNDRSLQFEKDDKHLLVAEADHVRSVEVGTGNSRELFPNEYCQIFFSKDGQRALRSFKDPANVRGAVSSRLVDLHSGEVIKNFTSNYNAISKAAFSPDSHYLAMVTADQVRLVDLRNINQFKSVKTGSTAALGFSPDGKYLFYGGFGGTLYQATLPSLSDIRSTAVGGGITAITVAPAGDLVAVGTASGKVFMLSAQTLKDLGNGKAIYDYILGLEFSQDMKQLLVYTSNSIEAWSLQQTQRLWYYPKDMPLDQQKFPTVKLKDWYPKAQGIINFVKKNDKLGRDVISPDGQSVLGFTDQFYLRKGNIATGTLIKTYRQHDGKVTAAAFSNDNRLIASVADDHTLKLWDNKSGTLRATMLAIDSTQWFWVTPEGFYSASRDAAKQVNFSSKGKISRFDQFDLIQNRPDSVLKKIGYASDSLVQFYSELVTKRLQRAGFVTANRNAHVSLPDVSLLSGATLPDSSTVADINIEVLATDIADSLREINLWQNGVPKGKIQIEKANQGPGKQVRVKFPVKLAEGRNFFEVAATNYQGAESIKEFTEIKYAPPIKRKPELYLVVIGVSEYQHYPDAHLAFAAKDAENLAAAFKASTLFSKKHIFQLTDAEVKRDTLIKLSKQLAKAAVDDYVIIAYSGHGVLDKNLDFYFCTNQTDVNNLKYTSFSFDEMDNLLKTAPPLKKLLLIDACYSGDVDKSAGPGVQQLTGASKGLHIGKAKVIIPGGDSNAKRQNSFELAKELFVDLKRGSGATVISSSSGVEVSYERENVESGLFTYAILNAINQVKPSPDRHILLSELANNVIKTVADLSKGLQTPTLREQNIEFDYPVW